MRRRPPRPSYVRGDGRLVRPSSRFPNLVPSRAFLAAVAVAALLVANPANEAHRWPDEARRLWEGGGGREGYGSGSRGRRGTGGGSGEDGYVESLWDSLDSISRSVFGTDASSLFGGAGTAFGGAAAGGTTNYVLYSLERDYDGVVVAALLRRFRLCHFGAEEGRGLCRWVDATFCHGMRAFDPKNRAFTAHRLLEVTLIFSAVLSWCSRWKYRRGASLRQLAHHPLDVLLSVFSAPTALLGDMYSLNVFVYPALVSMERLLTKGDPSDRARFYLASSLLTVGSGALSNLAGSVLTGGGEVGGLRGVAAAALGYRMAVHPRQAVVSYLGVRMTASEVLLAASVVGGISCMWGVNIGLWMWDGGTLTAWVCGGMLGNALAKSLVRRYGFGWFSFY